jgi:DNA invertase Pin-like site-specific DNA recombinase
LIRKRTSDGLAAAKARGRAGVRPKALDANKQELAVNLYHDGHHTIKEICQMMDISKPTLYKYVDAKSEK